MTVRRPRITLYGTIGFLSVFVAANFAPTASALVTQVSTGEVTACAIVDRAVKCWGNNAQGQLGNGTVGSNTVVPMLSPQINMALPQYPLRAAAFLVVQILK